MQQRSSQVPTWQRSMIFLKYSINHRKLLHGGFLLEDKQLWPNMISLKINDMNFTSRQPASEIEENWIAIAFIIAVRNLSLSFPNIPTGHCNAKNISCLTLLWLHCSTGRGAPHHILSCYSARHSAMSSCIQSTIVTLQIWYYLYMVRCDEDAYWPDNLSLFSVSCEHYREPKKQNYGENWLLWFICMSGECCRIICVLQGVQKNCQKCHFWSPF